MIHGRRNGKMPSGQRLGRIRHFIQRTELFAYLIQRIDVCSPMKRIRHQYAIGPLIRRCPAESPMIGTHAVTPELKATVAVVDRSGQQWVTDTQTIMLPRLIKRNYCSNRHKHSLAYLEKPLPENVRLRHTK